MKNFTKIARITVVLFILASLGGGGQPSLRLVNRIAAR
jgi:hypothetical protein